MSFTKKIDNIKQIITKYCTTFFDILYDKNDDMIESDSDIESDTVNDMVFGNLSSIYKPNNIIIELKPNYPKLIESDEPDDSINNSINQSEDESEDESEYEPEDESEYEPDESDESDESDDESDESDDEPEDESDDEPEDESDKSEDEPEDEPEDDLSDESDDSDDITESDWEKINGIYNISKTDSNSDDNTIKKSTDVDLFISSQCVVKDVILYKQDTTPIFKLYNYLKNIYKY